LDFSSVLDLFGGSGSVGFKFKINGKKVIFNDALLPCYYTGLAFIENKKEQLTDNQGDDLLDFEIPGKEGFLAAYDGWYFTSGENRWLEVMVARIAEIRNRYHKALAYHALSQSCLAKRPFNLFHRRNLYLRQARVERTFYNAGMWEEPFPSLFRRFSNEACLSVTDNTQTNKAWNLNAFSIQDTDVDLVYLDPPSVDADGESTDYYLYYGFLEWLYRRPSENLVDYVNRKRAQIRWSRSTALPQLVHLFERFRHSKIILSYREPGIPGIDLLRKSLSRYKKVKVFRKEHQYVLSRAVGSEVLLVGA
jgi:adenine-specific DNA methylase